ncbi:MAG TPA: hypothetical protein VF608_15805 [Thermoanaerobaculia bacterium]
MSKRLLVWSIEQEQPLSLDAASLIAHLMTPGTWPEAVIHPDDERDPYPRMLIEHHRGAGVLSLVCFEDSSSTGHVASVGTRMSAPTVYVCLGGQVIEQWPRELFLQPALAEIVVAGFLENGRQSTSCSWIKLNGFERTTVHPGGRGLIEMWKRLQQDASS